MQAAEPPSEASPLKSSRVNAIQIVFVGLLMLVAVATWMVVRSFETIETIKDAVANAIVDPVNSDPVEMEGDVPNGCGAFIEEEMIAAQIQTDQLFRCDTQAPLCSLLYGIDNMLGSVPGSGCKPDTNHRCCYNCKNKDLLANAQEAFGTDCENMVMCPGLTGTKCDDWCSQRGGIAYPIKSESGRTFVADHVNFLRADVVEGELLNKHVKRVGSEILDTSPADFVTRDDRGFYVCVQAPECCQHSDCPAGKFCNSKERCVTEEPKDIKRRPHCRVQGGGGQQFSACLVYPTGESAEVTREQTSVDLANVSLEVEVPKINPNITTDRECVKPGSPVDVNQSRRPSTLEVYGGFETYVVYQDGSTKTMTSTSSWNQVMAKNPSSPPIRVGARLSTGFCVTYKESEQRCFNSLDEFEGVETIVPQAGYTVTAEGTDRGEPRTFDIKGPTELKSIPFLPDKIKASDSFASDVQVTCAHPDQKTCSVDPNCAWRNNACFRRQVLGEQCDGLQGLICGGGAMCCLAMEGDKCGAGPMKTCQVPIKGTFGDRCECDYFNTDTLVGVVTGIVAVGVLASAVYYRRKFK